MRLANHYTHIVKSKINKGLEGGSRNDWVLFQRIEIGKKVMKGALLPYKLIGDAVYPTRRWFYSRFKSEKDGLPRNKSYWNFIQSNIRMAVERALRMLKYR